MPTDHNQYTCPVKGCNWRFGPKGTCPTHREKAIENPNYGSDGPDKRTLIKEMKR